MTSVVAQQWEATDKTKFMVAMYHNMFTAHPEWKDKFTKLQFPIVDSHEAFVHQVDVTKVAFDAAVKMADDDAKLKATLKAMAKQHINYGVTQTEFQALKPILAATVKAQVSGADTAAWTTVVAKVLDNIVP